jgi:monofunctional glycosyltransferase
MARPAFSFVRLAIRLLLLILGACLVYLFWLPDVASLRTTNPTTTSLIELRKAQALRGMSTPIWFWEKDPVTLREIKPPPDAAKRNPRELKIRMRWRPLDEISPNLVHAIVLAEDDRFYVHQGFDIEQIRIAFERNWAKKRFVYGGSTLTQQLARTLYLSPHKNLLRKAKEALITYQLEKTLSKQRILEIYLNVVEWGNGIYGAEAASEFYFATTADRLTPDQAVALASILPSPRRWSPLSEKAFMARRRSRLIERMQREGYVPVEVSTEVPTEFLDGYPVDDLSGEAHVPPSIP